MVDFSFSIYLASPGPTVNLIDGHLRAQNITLKWGIFGNQPYDRVASVGTIEFSLDNSAHNPAGLEGYWSPNHANCRPDFKINQDLYVYLISNLTSSKKFKFWISDISPVSGKYGAHITTVTAQDTISKFLDAELRTTAVQANKRTDELYTLIRSDVGAAQVPTAILDTTPDTFAYALDDLGERPSALSAIQRAVQSDGSIFHVPGNGGSPGGPRLQSRNARAAYSSVDATFDDTMTDLVILHGENQIYNDITVSIANRKIDDTEVILYSSNAELPIPPMQSVKLSVRFVDPNQQAERVSLYPGSGVTPVADTDYRMSSVGGGSGNDMNAYLSMSINWYASTAEVTLSNTDPYRTGYVNLFNLRGRGMYMYTKQDANVQDATSISAYGRRTLKYTLPYQSNLNVAYDFANALLTRYKAPQTFVTGVEFVANVNNTFATYAKNLDISSRVYVKETVTGVAGYFFVNSCEYTLERGSLLRVRLGLVPANTTNVWILGDATRSVLGSTTMPNMYI